MAENYRFLFEFLFEIIAGTAAFFFRHIFVWNLIFAIIIVFFQRREPRSVWAWLLLLYFLPVLGFVFYLLIGQDIRKRKMFQIKGVEDHFNKAIRQQEYRIKSTDPKTLNRELGNYADLIMYNLEVSGAVLSGDNAVGIYVDGNGKFEALIADLEQAERFIHLQYYIIRNDVLFQRIRDVLARKAAQGVEVRVLFDAMGCRKTPRSLWKKLNAQGIQTAEFFPAVLGGLQLRVNYRNHRKIVVIDNKTAYVGGFNVGKEYIDLDKKFGHWRDTHLRVQGSAVQGLELRFLLDWNYAAKENLLLNPHLLARNAAHRAGECKIQVISSGPDNAAEQVRDNYLRLISKAQRCIYIQTPYFIPDEAIFGALLIAAKSGIEVNIMFPCKPDHPFVYWATYSYIGDMIRAGANCYRYDDGFLHSKGVIVDDSAFCYGTANMDIRSFALNFEVNVTVYDGEKALEMVRLFQEDVRHSTLITRDIYAERKLLVRAKEQVCRLLSPLL